MSRYKGDNKETMPKPQGDKVSGVGASQNDAAKTTTKYCDKGVKY